MSAERERARARNGVLLTGGTGFVGRHLRTVPRSYEVILLGRKKPADLLDNERWSYLDLPNPFKPEILADGEVLCHLAYSLEAGRANGEHNRHPLQAVTTVRTSVG
jgi:nucleoside-diphosphate-sugar epimerase